MPKRKHNPDQKSKQGFDSSKTDAEFSSEFGSASANQAHKDKAKKSKKLKNQGEWGGMH